MKNFIIALLVASIPLAALEAQDEEVETIDVEHYITVGDDGTKSVDTNLNGFPVPADKSPIFIGNTVDSADAITIDSGANFPPGIAFRRYLGEIADPQSVIAGTQLGYLDFRAYSGTQFYNAASLDVVVDGSVSFAPGGLPPTKMRFAVSNGDKVYVPMELRADGRLEIGAIGLDGSYAGPGLLGNPNLFVNTAKNTYAAIFAARPSSGPAYAMRVHTGGETVSDYLIAGSSGDDNSIKFSVRGNGDVHLAGDLFVAGRDVGALVDEMAADILATSTLVDDLAIRLGVTSTAVDDLTATLGTTSAVVDDLANRITGSAVTIGLGAQSTSGNSAAIGANAVASGTNAIAFGNDSRANGSSAISIGDGTISSGQGNVAVGSGAIASAKGSLAFGTGAKAIRDSAIAIGGSNLAQGEKAIALGNGAIALADRATALGSGADVRHANSTAVGAGAKTTAADQVMLGAAGSSVVVADIDASTAAQVGPVDVVTVDANGTLGRQQVATARAVDEVRVSMDYIAAVTDAEVSALADRATLLEGRVGALFDLTDTIDKDARRGIAAIAAMAHPHFPSEAGKTSYSSNVAVYRGEVGLSAGVMHRFEGDFALTAGATYAGGNSTAVRAGIAGEF